VVDAALNGRAVIRFDGQGTSLAIPDSASLRWGTGDFTLEIVASFTNDPAVGDGYGLLYGKFEGIYPYLGPSFWANYFAGNSIATTVGGQVRVDESLTGTSTGLNDGQARVYGMRRTGLTHLELRVDGALNSARPISIANGDALSSFVYIGGQQTPSGVIQALQGDIAEIVAVGGTLNPVDLVKLETYLKNKYGL
jgi:hypothetical protein